MENLTKLNQYRQEIDSIDSQILDLLTQRMQVVEAVGDFKRAQNKGTCFIAPAREAKMLRKITSLAPKTFSKSAISSIWRKIISSANDLEEDMKIAIFNPKQIADYYYIIREYYGDFMAIEDQNSVTGILSAIENDEVKIGAFKFPTLHDDAQNWWINLANNSSNLHVYSLVPFVQNSKQVQSHQLITVAKIDPQDSGSDKTLLVVESPKSLVKSDITRYFTDQQVQAEVISCANVAQIQDVTFYLIELDGFFKKDAPILKKFKEESGLYCSVIGSFAIPIYT